MIGSQRTAFGDNTLTTTRGKHFSRRGVWRSGRDESAYLVRQLESWDAASGGVWVDPDGGLEDDFDDMGVASWDGGAWNDDGA